MKLKLPPGVSRSDVEQATQKARTRRSRTSKARGREFENLVCEKLREATGLGEEDIYRQRTGFNNFDIGLSAKARQYLGRLKFEAKDHKVIKMPEWIRQATANAGEGVPVVVFKLPGNREKLYVTLDFDLFINLTMLAFRSVA